MGHSINMYTEIENVTENLQLCQFFPFTFLSFFFLCAVPENIHSSPTEGFFVLHPPSPAPQEIPVYFHTFLLRNYLLRSPFPLGISNHLPWRGYGFFLELHIIYYVAQNFCAPDFCSYINLLNLPANQGGEFLHPLTVWNFSIAGIAGFCPHIIEIACILGCRIFASLASSKFVIVFS